MAIENPHPGERGESGATRAAVLTPPGAGAIAVVRVWGPHAVGMVDGLFRPASGRGLSHTPPGRPRVGRLGGSGVGDQVVVEVFDGAAIVEIQCHGGRAAPLAVMEALAGAGATVVDPSLACAQAATSVIVAQALEDLPHAATLKTAAILLDQANGALDREIAAVAGLIESDREQALARLGTLVDRAAIGLGLSRGWTVALAGRPNVGKSRLLNAIVGRERALVDPRPGTTRDLVTASVALEGWPVELVDTAGEREAQDAIEREGITRARAARAQADLVLLVLDGSTPLEPADHVLIKERVGRIVVANKCDLPPAWPLDEVGVDLAVSAERGDGLEELAASIAGRLVGEALAAGAPTPFRASHVQALSQARQDLDLGHSGAALERLGRLTSRPGPPTLSDDERGAYALAVTHK